MTRTHLQAIFYSALAWGCFTSSSYAGAAHPYSQRVQDACKPDYYQHCSQFSIGTEELSKCMRQVGEHLSMPCLAALADDGQITKAEIDHYYATHSNAPPKASDVTGAKKSEDVATAKVGKPKPAIAVKDPAKSKTSGKLVAAHKGAKGTKFAAGEKKLEPSKTGKHMKKSSLVAAGTKSSGQAADKTAKAVTGNTKSAKTANGGGKKATKNNALAKAKEAKPKVARATKENDADW